MSAPSFLPARLIQEINKANPKLLYAVRIDYSVPVLAHTGVGDQIINNEVYLGVGKLGKIDPVREENSTSPSDLTLTLTGLDPTLAAEILNERNNNKKVEIYWCSLNADNRVDSFARIFTGRTISGQYQYDQDNASVLIRVADRLIDWSRKATQRFSDQSHSNDPNSKGDRFCVYIEQASQVPIYWGSKKDGPGFRYID